MPKYTVSDVLDIIKNLSAEEKLQLQQELPSVLDSMSTPTNLPVESHSQNIEGINIDSGNSNIEFNQNQVDRGSNNTQSSTETSLKNIDLQEALSLLEQLKQNIITSNDLNPIEKKSLEVPIQTIEEELKKPNPNKNIVEQSFDVLKKYLIKVAPLAPLAQLLMILISLVKKL